MRRNTVTYRRPQARRVIGDHAHTLTKPTNPEGGQNIPLSSSFSPGAFKMEPTCQTKSGLGLCDRSMSKAEAGSGLRGRAG